MSFFRKLRFFLIFLVFYFFICRIQEFLSLEHGWDWSGIVDPMKVRVKALKSILARRGISTDTVVERQDLVTLVRSSGRLTVVEKKAIEEDTEKETEVSDFSSVAHFDKLLAGKDRLWLVEINYHKGRFVPVETWRRLTRYLRPFGFRFGRVDCFHNFMLCTRKNFHRSDLLLAMPKGHSRMKDSVIYSWFSKRPELPLILRWLRTDLATRIPILEGSSLALNIIRTAPPADDRTASSLGDFIVALDFEQLQQIPLLFSALSVRFTGRVRFWGLDTSAARQLFSNSDSGNRSGTFFLLSSGARTSYEYGAQPNRAEATTFRALALFLRMNYPEANDCLIGLSYLVCMLAMLFLVLGRKDALHRIPCSIASLLAYGLLFLVLYFLLEHLVCHPDLPSARLALLTFCRILTQSELGARIRSDCLSERYSALRVAIWFSVYLLIVAIFEHRRGYEEAKEEESVTRSVDPGEANARHALRPTQNLSRLGFNGEDEEDTEEAMEEVQEEDAQAEEEEAQTEEEESQEEEEEAQAEEEESQEEEEEAQAEPSQILTPRPIAPTRQSEQRRRRNLSMRPPSEEAAHGSQGPDIEEFNRILEIEEFNRIVNFILSQWQQRNKDYLETLLVWNCRHDPSVKENAKWPQGASWNRQCSVCMCDFRLMEALCLLPCGHVYHEHCVKRWLQEPDRDTCPVCRWPAFRSK